MSSEPNLSAVPGTAPPASGRLGVVEGPEGTSGLGFDALLDVSLPVIIEIGRANITLSEALELRAGSVIQLDRAVGEPVDIHVSDRKIAEGEVVVIGDRFGIRVTRVLGRSAESDA